MGWLCSMLRGHRGGDGPHPPLGVSISGTPPRVSPRGFKERRRAKAGRSVSVYAFICSWDAPALRARQERSRRKTADEKAPRERFTKRASSGARRSLGVHDGTAMTCRRVRPPARGRACGHARWRERHWLRWPDWHNTGRGYPGAYAYPRRCVSRAEALSSPQNFWHA